MDGKAAGELHRGSLTLDFDRDGGRGQGCRWLLRCFRLRWHLHMRRDAGEQFFGDKVPDLGGGGHDRAA